MRKGLVVFMLWGLLLSLTACAKPEPDPKESELVTIRFLNNDRETDTIIAAFQELYPQYRVEKVSLGSRPPTIEGLIKRIEELLQGGHVDLMPGWTDLVSPELFLPLDPLIQRDGLDLSPYGALMDQLRHDGRAFTMPVDIDPLVIFYNKEMFAQAGVPEPHLDWTWEEFRHSAAALTRGNGDEKQWGAFTMWPSDFPILMIQQRTGQLPWEADAAAVEEALRFFSSMLQDGSIVPGQDIPYRDPAVVKHSEDRYFHYKRAAMYLRRGVRYAGHVYQVQSIKWGVAPIPALADGDRIAPAWPETYGISATSPNREAAWAFLKFLTGPDAAVIMARQGRIPAYSSPAVVEAWFEQSPTPDPSTAALFHIPWTQGRSAGWVTGDVVMAGQEDWEEALAEDRANKP